MLYTLRPANFCITFRADYGRAYDRIAWRENWGLVNRPAGMVAGGIIKRFTGAAALHHRLGYASRYPDTHLPECAQYCDVVCVVRFRHRDVVLHAVADYRLLQTPQKRAETLHYLATGLRAAGRQSVCFFASF